MEVGKPGPFQIIEGEGSGDLATPIEAPRRRYSCENYQTCLDLACALNWDSFTCRGCNGSVGQALLWRAHGARKRDRVALKLCQIPPIEKHEGDVGSDEPPPIKIVSEV